MSWTVRSWDWKRWVLVGAVVIGVLLFAYMAVAGAQTFLAWRSIDRVAFDLDDARDDLIDSGQAVDSFAFLNTDYDAVLVIGSDDRPEEYIGDQEAAYADAVILYLSPKDGSDPLLVSIPRDLLVTDPCTGEDTKLDRTLTPCGDDISDIVHVGLTVQQFTGLAIEDVAVIDLAGFVGVIDTIGGVRLCSDHALREGDDDLLPSGCTVVDGATALAWVRSRKTQEFVDGDWRFVEGVGDASRNERQQLLLLALLSKLKSMRSPTQLAGVVSEMGDAVRLGDNLGMAGAMSRAWDLRRISGSRIRRPVIPVVPGALGDGSYVVIATEPFIVTISR